MNETGDIRSDLTEIKAMLKGSRRRGKIIIGLFVAQSIITTGAAPYSAYQAQHTRRPIRLEFTPTPCDQAPTAPIEPPPAPKPAKPRL
jgi:hypothetical protein